MHASPIDRRTLLLGGAGVLGGAALAATTGCRAEVEPARASLADPGDTRLVVIELVGGNDGLSTLVPFEDDHYQRARRATRLARADLLPIHAERGLHPALVHLRERYERGELAMIEGAGYAQPSYSHFRTLEVWHTAREGGRATGDGWIGRLRTQAWGKDPRRELILHTGPEMPYSVHCSELPPLCFTSPDNYDWLGSPAQLGALRDAANERSESAASGSMLQQLRATLQDAQSNSPRVLAALRRFRSRATYPDHSFGHSLRTVAGLLTSGFEARVCSVALGNFDTHGGDQPFRQKKLLTILDQGLEAFRIDLEGTSVAPRVAVLAYSEFGRRVEENASGGTDHGAAGPMFLLGPMVRGGLHGRHPSLTALDDNGNLEYTTDFRRVYASVLEQWLGVDSTAVLPARYEPLPLFSV